MKKRIWAYCLSAVLLLALVISVILIINNGDLIEKLSQPPTVPNADALCVAALDGLDPDNCSYITTTQKLIHLDSGMYKEYIQSTVSYEMADTLRGAATRTAQYGEHNVDIQEYYANGTLYLTVQGSRFCSNLSVDEYRRRDLPLCLITPDLYTEISAWREKDTIIVSLSGATKPEAWLSFELPEMLEAAGTMVLTKEGVLLESTYTISYEQSGAKIQFEASSEVIQETDFPATKVIEEDYTQILCPDAPVILEKAYGHLLESTNLTASYTDTTLCQAFGDLRQQNIDLCSSNAESFTAEIYTDTLTSNTGKTDSETTLTKVERFDNDKYSYSIDGSDLTEDASVDAEAIKTHLQNILISTIMLPEHIVQTQQQDDNQQYTIHFTASEEFAKLLRDSACLTLYQDANILNAQSQAYQTDSVSCYLTVDSLTSLPLASGVRYTGTYTIDTFPYLITFTADQSYSLS